MEGLVTNLLFYFPMHTPACMALETELLFDLLSIFHCSMQVHSCS